MLKAELDWIKEFELSLFPFPLIMVSSHISGDPSLLLAIKVEWLYDQIADVAVKPN